METISLYELSLFLLKQTIFAEQHIADPFP